MFRANGRQTFNHQFSNFVLEMIFEDKSVVAVHIGNIGKSEPREESIGFDFTQLESFSNWWIPVRLFEFAHDWPTDE